MQSHLSVAPAQEQVEARESSRSWKRIFRAEWLIFLLFVGPNLLLFAIFTYWPMIRAFYLSGVRWDMISPTKTWVGFANYQYLFHDDDFRATLINSLYFSLGSIGGSLILGLGAALLLNLPLRGRDTVRAAVFAPNLLSGAAISIVWVYMFDPRFGVIQAMLELVRNHARQTGCAIPIGRCPPSSSSRSGKRSDSPPLSSWPGCRAIPRDLYEAAKVDGAGALWRFRSVTLPMLSPIVFFLTVTSVLSSFQSFDIIRVMTQGGPVNSTSTLIWYIYEQGFVAFNAGRSSAATVILFMFLLVFTLFQVRVNERRVHYGD